jgi:2-keto-3-deoxy-6-phosphogluconate aldolase
MATGQLRKKRRRVIAAFIGAGTILEPPNTASTTIDGGIQLESGSGFIELEATTDVIIKE